MPGASRRPLGSSCQAPDCLPRLSPDSKGSLEAKLPSPGLLLRRLGTAWPAIPRCLPVPAHLTKVPPQPAVDHAGSQSPLLSKHSRAKSPGLFGPNASLVLPSHKKRQEKHPFADPEVPLWFPLPRALSVSQRCSQHQRKWTALFWPGRLLAGLSQQSYWGRKEPAQFIGQAFLKLPSKSIFLEKLLYLIWLRGKPSFSGLFPHLGPLDKRLL